MLRLLLSMAVPIMQYPAAHTSVPTIIPTVKIERGALSQFAIGPSIGTKQYRQEVGELPLNLPDDIVLLAVADCDRIGYSGHISINGSPFEKFFVFDCSGHPHTTKWMLEANVIGEVDYFTALRHDIIGEGAVGEIMWFE